MVAEAQVQTTVEQVSGPSKIFLSYRRGDSTTFAGQISNRLVAHYRKEKDKVISEVGHIPARMLPRDHIRSLLNGVAVLLLVIGPNWVEMTDRKGNRRLDDPEDVVRLEIEVALAQDIPIKLLLVRGTPEPLVERLPESIRDIIHCESLRFSDDTPSYAELFRLYSLLNREIATQQSPETRTARDDSEPSLARQTTLQVTVTDNIRAGRPPYHDVRLQSLGELHWVLKQNGRSVAAGSPGRTDLRNVNLAHLNLSRINLTGAMLCEAHLEGANLADSQCGGADFSEAKLDGAQFHKAELRHAKFDGASLSGARLVEAHLESSTFLDAQLSDTYFTGAYLSGANLTNLDLTKTTLAGANLSNADLSGTTLTNLDLSSTALAGALLNGADLQDAILKDVDLKGANMSRAVLEGAQLERANLQGAILVDAHVTGAHLEGAHLGEADLTHAYMAHAHLQGADLAHANLSSADLDGTHLEQAKLQHVTATAAHFVSAHLKGADLSSAILGETHLENAELQGATLVGATLINAYLAGTQLDRADLTRCNLSGAHIDSVEDIKGSVLDVGTQLDRVHWGGIPPLPFNRRPKRDEGTGSIRDVRMSAFNHEAIVYHQLAEKMSGLGLLAPASDYRLREQKMRRKEFFWRGNIGSWLFSWILYLVAGYGEKPLRTLLWYLATVTGFAAIYYALTNFVTMQAGRLTWYEAAVLSLSSFHGRGFIPATVHLGDPIAGIAAVEAITGLFIELIFIATFTRRFLGN